MSSTQRTDSAIKPGFAGFPKNVPAWASITDAQLDALRGIVAAVEAGTIGGQAAKAAFKKITHASFNAPNKNLRLIAFKMRRNISRIEHVRAEWKGLQ